jgi:hypothetical protein
MSLVDDATWKAKAGESEILYTELVKDGSPAFSIENDTSSVKRSLLINWDDLGDARLAFLGGPQIMGAAAAQFGPPAPGASSWISRHLPDAFRLFGDTQGRRYLYATKFSGSGYGMPVGSGNGIHDGSDTPIYRYAKIEVVYETLTYDIVSDDDMVSMGLTFNNNPDEATLARYVTKEINPGAEYLTLPAGGFKFVTTGTPPVQGGPGKIVPNFDLALTWHLVPLKAVGCSLLNPQLEDPPIDNCLGNVNSEDFPAVTASGNPGWPMGTLLMTGATIKPVRSTFGDRLYDLTYRFKFLKKGIQLLYYQGTQANLFHDAGYFEVTTTGTTNLVANNNDPGSGAVNIYPWADFNQLFRVPD